MPLGLDSHPLAPNKSCMIIKALIGLNYKSCITQFGIIGVWLRAVRGETLDFIGSRSSLILIVTGNFSPLLKYTFVTA